MTTKDSRRKADGNGIPRPVVRWFKAAYRPAAKCKQCLWTALPCDLALARLHVKTFPDHRVTIHQDTVTEVYAETTDGRDWAEAVNEG